MRWIAEVEMATSVDDLKTSQSIFGNLFPNFETLDAKIASFWKKIIPKLHFKKVYLEMHKAKKITDSFAEGRSLSWSMNISGQQAPMWLFSMPLIYSVLYMQSLYKLWILSGYNNTTKSSQETKKSLRKFLGPWEKLKVIWTDNSLEFGKACEELSWNHCTSTPHCTENDIAGRAVRRIKEGTSAVLLQSSLDERWWADSMECSCYLRNVRDLFAETVWKAIWKTIQWTTNSLRIDDRVSSDFRRWPATTPPVWCNTSNVVCVLLTTSKYSRGIGDDTSLRTEFNSWFNVMTINTVTPAIADRSDGFPSVFFFFIFPFFIFLCHLFIFFIFFWKDFFRFLHFSVFPFFHFFSLFDVFSVFFSFVFSCFFISPQPSP